jgi:hypothetical protein
MKPLDAAITNLITNGIKHVGKYPDHYAIIIHDRSDYSSLRGNEQKQPLVIVYYPKTERVYTREGTYYDNSTPECMYVKLTLTLFLNVEPDTFFPTMKRSK